MNSRSLESESCSFELLIALWGSRCSRHLFVDFVSILKDVGKEFETPWNTASLSFRKAPVWRIRLEISWAGQGSNTPKQKARNTRPVETTRKRIRKKLLKFSAWLRYHQKTETCFQTKAPNTSWEGLEALETIPKPSLLSRSTWT